MYTEIIVLICIVVVATIIYFLFINKPADSTTTSTTTSTTDSTTDSTADSTATTSSSSTNELTTQDAMQKTQFATISSGGGEHFENLTDLSFTSRDAILDNFSSFMLLYLPLLDEVAINTIIQQYTSFTDIDSLIAANKNQPDFNEKLSFFINEKLPRCYPIAVYKYNKPIEYINEKLNVGLIGAFILLKYIIGSDAEFKYNSGIYSKPPEKLKMYAVTNNNNTISPNNAVEKDYIGLSTQYIFEDNDINNYCYNQNNLCYITAETILARVTKTFKDEYQNNKTEILKKAAQANIDLLNLYLASGLIRIDLNRQYAILAARATELASQNLGDSAEATTVNNDINNILTKNYDMQAIFRNKEQQYDNDMAQYYHPYRRPPPIIPGQVFQPFRARYLIIKTKSNDYINLSEIRVYDEYNRQYVINPNDIKINNPYINPNTGATYPVSNFVDGDTDINGFTFIHTQSKEAEKDFIQIDFGNEGINILKIILRNRKSYGQSRINGVYIKLSLFPEDATTTLPNSPEFIFNPINVDLTIANSNSKQWYIFKVPNKDMYGVFETPYA